MLGLFFSLRFELTILLRQTLKRTEARLRTSFVAWPSLSKMADDVNAVCAGNILTKHCKTQRQDKNTKAKKKKKKSKKPTVEINSRKDRRIITEYHTLNKRIDSVRKNPSIQREDKASQIATLEAKKEKLGGINAYQKASRLGEARHGSFNSAKWVLKQMRAFNVLELKANKTKVEDEKLRLLDVGALDNNYKKYSKWIQCTPIDLNPQSNEVIKADFLKLDSKKEYDVVVMSLVVNFEGDIRKRGDMLRKCQEIVVDQGYLFIVLPLPCLNNSRYLNEELFISMIGSLGFDVCSRHNSKKLSFFMFRKTHHAQVKSFPKKVLRKGGNHNNFAIVL